MQVIPTRTDNIPCVISVEADCGVNAVTKTAVEDCEDFVMFVDELMEEAFGETCVMGWDVSLK